MSDLIIIGAGGFAKEVIWLAKACGKKILGILDDNSELWGKELYGYTILGGIDEWINFDDVELIIAIGTPKLRSIISNKIGTSANYANLIHPSAILSENVQLGKGNIITAGVILTVDISLGDHVIVNINSTIGHDCRIGSFVTIAPLVAISGNVIIDSFVEVGTGACIRQNLEIHEGSMIGMGAVLTKDVPSYSLYFGAPAKKIRSLS